MIKLAKDTGNYRVIRKEEKWNGETKIWFEPQAEVKFWFWEYYTPIGREEDDGHMDTFISPYKCDTLEEAMSIINRYKNGELDNRTFEKVVYEEKV